MMNVQKPYLNPDFSLEVFTRNTGLSKQEVEFWVNTVYGKTFDGLIQQRRVAVLMGLLNSYRGLVSIEYYAKLSGFSNLESMEHSFSSELGINFIDYFEEIVMLAN
jgi:AraC-like DNA-binding protein